MATGTAAGFAAAYNTPFAAVLFVFETVIGIASPAALLPTVAATVIATTLTRAVVGSGPIYGQRSFGPESTMAMLSFATLGVLAALAVFCFKRVAALLEHGFAFHAVQQPLRAAIGGGLVGLIAIVLPEVVGNGFEPLNAILDQRMLPIGVAWLLVAKVFATGSSVASGVPGGTMTPMLLVGAALGSLWAQVVGWLLPTAASIQAPLTAAMLVFELSGDYAIVLPLLLATVVATAASRTLGSESVYDAQLRRGSPEQATHVE